MQNLALSSQFSNSGRRGSSSSNTFNSLVLNGVLPPNEDGRVEGIKMKPPKKIYFPKPKSIGDGFPDKKDGDFRKERTKDWEIEEDNVFGKGKDSASGPNNVPYSDFQRKLEEQERERNRPETQEEKERREYGYQLFDRLRNLFNPIPNDWVIDSSILKLKDFFDAINEAFLEPNDEKYFYKIIDLMLKDLLSGNSSGWYFEEMLKFIKDKERNIGKEYTFEQLPEYFDPTLKTFWKPDRDNIREIESVRLKVVVKFVNGKAVAFIYAIIKRPDGERTILLYEQPMEF
jgi:hypothetical protein